MLKENSESWRWEFLAYKEGRGWGSNGILGQKFTSFRAMVADGGALNSFFHFLRIKVKAFVIIILNRVIKSNINNIPNWEIDLNLFLEIVPSLSGINLPRTFRRCTCGGI